MRMAERGIQQGSVLGPMKFCLYLLPIGASYHIYEDDTQLYISLSKDPLEALTKLNMCISHIRLWMIKNKYSTILKPNL